MDTGCFLFLASMGYIAGRKAPVLTELPANASDYVNTNVDVPAMPAATEAIFDEKDARSVIDLGGDDRGWHDPADGQC